MLEATRRQPAAPSAAQTESGTLQEFLAFTLGEEEYAIDILRVQEIRGYETVTKIASTPPFIKGVINLRGTIVPIVDLRIRFGLSKVDYDEFTVVIILNVGKRTVGIVVDRVSDVIALTREQIKEAPALSGHAADHIRGLGTVEQRMLIVLDIERLMLSPDMGLSDVQTLQ